MKNEHSKLNRKSAKQILAYDVLRSIEEFWENNNKQQAKFVDVDPDLCEKDVGE